MDWDMMRVAGWVLIGMGGFLIYERLKLISEYFLLISQEPSNDPITERARFVWSALFFVLGTSLLLFAHFHI